MKITVNRALMKIKTLQKRYDKELRDLQLIAVKKGDKLSDRWAYYKESDFIEKAKSSFQSVTDIKNNIVTLKKLVVASNQITHVNIGGSDYTVQDAIIRKNYIANEEHLVEKMKTLVSTAKAVFDAETANNEKEIEKMVANSSDKDKEKIIEVKKDAETFIEQHKAIKFVDPLGLEKKVENLEKSIFDFKNNVDYALSTSNSTTYIEIPDNIDVD